MDDEAWTDIGDDEEVHVSPRYWYKLQALVAVHGPPVRILTVKRGSQGRLRVVVACGPVRKFKSMDVPVGAWEEA